MRGALVFQFMVLSTAFLLSWNLHAAAGKSFDDASLEELLEIPTYITTKTAKPIRSSPGSVSLITSDEIKSSGARDIVDVLQLVPGIAFGNDSFGVTSIAMRGIWANEGKLLLMVDGQEMNDSLYATTQYANRYPVDQIDRIEIVRGPGSAIYGGYAELAVINIITKNGATLNGCEVVGKYGQMQKTFGHRTMSAACGKKTEGGTDVSVAVFTGEANQSDRSFTGYDGTALNTPPDPATKTETYNFKNENQTKPLFINLGISDENFNFRYIKEQYTVDTTTIYGYADLHRGVETQFEGQYFDLDYNFKLSSKWSVKPIVQYKTQYPWKVIDFEANPYTAGNIRVDKTLTGVSATYAFSESGNLLFGAEHTHEHGDNRTFQGFQATFQPSGGTRDYSTDAAYAQGTVNFFDLDLTAGARFDDHSQAGKSFVPRFGVTKSTENWHAKLLASGAFRAPTIMNLDSNARLKPDRTKTYEIEAGFATSKSSYLTANLFDTEIKDPIVYGVDNAGVTHNFNADRIATRGAELEYRLKKTWGYATVNYSYYRAFGAESAVFEVPGHKEALLGFPQHKIALNSSFVTPVNGLKVNPVIVLLGDYYGYNWDDIAKQRFIEKQKSQALANLFLTYRAPTWKNLDLGAGCFNILDKDYRLVQPYSNGNHAPLPTPSREFVVRADYKVEF